MINFGTDGWRGIIADDFTFENVRIVAQAICDYILSHKRQTQRLEATLVIGCDTRFLSDWFAREAACVAAANGIKVFLSENFAPTPAISYSVVDRKADGAIMLTASHNPPLYNGLKFKAPYGGSAIPAITNQIEKHLRENQSQRKEPSYVNFEKALKNKLIEFFDPREAYLEHLSTLVNFDIAEGGRVQVVVDPMYGAGQGYLSQFLSRLGCRVKEIHTGIDPYFGGINPEPLPANLEELRKVVTSQRYQVGLALDGDADRLCVIDADGSFINSHQIFALLLDYLVRIKGWRGKVVKTVSTTSMIDILTEEFGLELYETPIGFKYICEHILKDDVLIGGEESGGIGVKGHIPERDGILIGAYLIEIINYYQKTLSELLESLTQRTGRFYYHRLDLEIDSSLRENFATKMRKILPKETANLKVKRVEDRDGYKFYFEDKSWLMIRLSGTEDVVRIYAEAPYKQQVQKLIEAGQRIVGEIR